jgi:hypothetical protein
MTATRFFNLLSAAALTGLIASPAAAQDALGGGNVLDANLGVGTGRINAPLPVEDFRARNLIVTGDVAGGRGFRGTVGYTAEGDFRDALGSDDLFDFRARAFLSAPHMINYGTITEQFRIGQEMGLVEFRRDTASPAVGRVVEPAWHVDPLRTDRMMFEPMRLDLLAQGITTSAMIQMASEPRPMGVAYTRDGQALLVTASPVQGLFGVPMQEFTATAGLTAYDVARLRGDVAAGLPLSAVGRPFETRFEHLEQVRERAAGPGRIEDGRQSDAILAEHATAYAQVLERIVQRYRGMENVDLYVDRSAVSELDDAFAELREALAQQEARRLSRTAGLLPLDVDEPHLSEDPVEGRMTRLADEGDSDRPWRDRDVILPDSLVAAPGRSVDRPVEQMTVDVDRMLPVLRHGERVEQFGGAIQTRFNETLALAEESLRDGEYFMAERRFQRALRLSPGHPMATTGLAHSQIGAGLNVGPSLILQRLMTLYPEMIDVRYGPNLLPSRARLLQAVHDLEVRLADPRDRAAIAFLLAYLGHQLDDQAMVRKGLDAFEQEVPESALLPLLRGVWLAERDSAEPAK